MSAYKPTNSPAACPNLNDEWVSSEFLPPVPNRATCECMFKSLSCVPAKGLSVKKYGDLFGSICGQPGNPCAGISKNVTTGVYGAYSMCNSTQQLGYALDTYYQSQKSASSACDWDAQAVVQQPQQVNSNCDSLLASASASNSFAATATAGSGSGSSTGTNAAVPRPMTAVFTLGEMAVGLYVLVAAGAGARMVLL